MIDRAPWRAIAAVAGAIVLLVVAFRAPYDGTASVGGGEPTQPAHDAAAVAAAGPGVVETPEAQPTVDIPQPAPGEQPAQLVVVSVDGACESRDQTMTRFMDVGQQVGARFTFFVSGLCLLPEDQKKAYSPPGRPAGASDMPFADADVVAQRVRVFADMYRRGHEIGTHFVGHFCGAGGVGSWSAADWTSELGQTRAFLDQWPQHNPGITGLEPLPFNSAVFAGARTPCLEGDRPSMYEAFTAAGLRYDASDPGKLQWPRKVAGGRMWSFPLPALRLSGTDDWMLSMDYNLLVNQTGGKTEVPEEKCRTVEEQTYQTFMDGLEAVYGGNRAPLILGTHLNDWACNAYVNALQRFIVDAPARHPDIRLVSFADLANWLDEMDPTRLAELQELPEQRY